MSDQGQDSAGAVKLAGRLTVVEAHIIQDALAREDILTAIRQDHLASADLPNPGTDVELWVGADQVERAREVVDALTHDVHEGETIECPSCGEACPATYARCWKCDGALPPFEDEGGDVG